MTPEETAVPASNSAGSSGSAASPAPFTYGRAVSHVVLGLKTARGSRQLRLDPAIHEALLRERVSPG